ncbi:hypothetical protein MIZ03_1067 [Rhodoferax lithotrophicus]|uniref:Uncharacterized protein n=1 Tax=Rhodoferax lithotrophicus TaxID=2798804 RepID=A0ABN6D2F0_9BURK|nr:hypothetical protein MIZ03_1067 [Rhodoferax sp. MIZ03]
MIMSSSPVFAPAESVISPFVLIRQLGGITCFKNESMKFARPAPLAADAEAAVAA